MKILLQNMNKKATKQAYIAEVLKCSHDVITGYVEDNASLEMVNLEDIKQVSDFMLLNLFANECNYPNNKKLIPNIYDRVADWVLSSGRFGCQTYITCEWLVENNLVSADLIPQDKNITELMQKADERHYYYIAMTLLNNASQTTFNKLV